MKPSYYNFIYDYSEDTTKHVFYNARTNALALVDEPQYTAFVDFEHDNSKPLDEEFEKNLRYGGYVVDDDVDELDEIRYNLYSSRFSDTHMVLTIAPTSDCNFRCAYCYEKDSKKFPPMSESIQQDIINFVQQKANGLTSLSITWYGGEPLLALDVIERLTQKFLGICEEHHIRYSAGMISNGYLLTSSVSKKLSDLKIFSVQVTLDGDEETHNQRRPLAGGGPTFKRIIENLKHLDENIHVALRVNMDKTNHDAALSIVNVLRKSGLSASITPYLGRVISTNNCCDSALCYLPQEFVDIEDEFRLAHGFKRSYPIIKGSYCGADFTNGFVIDSDGKLYKCWSDIGIHERCIGEIGSYIFEKETLYQYMLYDPTLDENCKKCKYLPLCMGGCPNKRVLSEEFRCDPIKFSLKKYMENLPADLKE